MTCRPSFWLTRTIRPGICVIAPTIRRSGADPSRPEPRPGWQLWLTDDETPTGVEPLALARPRSLTRRRRGSSSDRAAAGKLVVIVFETGLVGR